MEPCPLNLSKFRLTSEILQRHQAFTAIAKLSCYHHLVLHAVVTTVLSRKPRVEGTQKGCRAYSKPGLSTFPANETVAGQSSCCEQSACKLPCKWLSFNQKNGRNGILKAWNRCLLLFAHWLQETHWGRSRSCQSSSPTHQGHQSCQ